MSSQSDVPIADESIGSGNVATVSATGSRRMNGRWTPSSRRSSGTSEPSAPRPMPKVPPVYSTNTAGPSGPSRPRTSTSLIGGTLRCRRWNHPRRDDRALIAHRRRWRGRRARRRLLDVDEHWARVAQRDTRPEQRLARRDLCLRRPQRSPRAVARLLAWRRGSARCCRRDPLDGGRRAPRQPGRARRVNGLGAVADDPRRPDARRRRPRRGRAASSRK